jgi:hypothetical protein
VFVAQFFVSFQVLYLKEVDTMLALVCIARSENFRKKSLIDYNISCLKKALQALVEPSVDVAPPVLANPSLLDIARVSE